MMKVQNMNAEGQIYFGLHMVPGVAEYREHGKEPYRILVGEDAAKSMDPTFRGKPMTVLHIPDNLDEDPAKIAGYVVESFYNRLDGKHWVKFVVISDEGLNAIQRGFTLSNEYIIKEYIGGGQSKGVDYDREVMRAEYERLAFVPNPRYEESTILTPEDFRLYNEKKELELNRLANSKDEGEVPMKLNFWKRSKIENTKDLDIENTMVELPKSKKEMSILEVVNSLDEIKMKNMDGYANDSHMVKCEDGEHSVKDLVAKYNAMMSEKNAGGEGEEAEVESLDNAEDEEKKKADEDAKNAADEEAKKKNEDDEAKKKEEEEAKKNAKTENFKRLKNAAATAQKEKVEAVADTAYEKVARGQARYGSK